MSESKSNTGLITIIAVVLIGILGILVYQSQQDSPAEEVAESVSGAIENATGQ